MAAAEPVAVPAPALRLASAAAFNLATVAVGVASGLGLAVTVAHAWSPEVYGAYVYASWLGQALALLAHAAFPALAVRLVAESIGRGESGRARRLLGRLVGASAASALLLAVLFLAVEGSSGRLASGGRALPIALLAVAQCLATVLALGAQGAGRFDLLFRATLATTVVAAAAGAGLALTGRGPTAVLAALAAGQAALALVLATGLRRSLPPGADGGGPSLAAVRPYFLVVSALGLVDLVVWQRSELLFLAQVGSGEDLALYGAAFTVATAVMRTAPQALAGVLTPAFATLAGGGSPRALAPLFARAVAVMAAGSALLALVGAAAGPLLLSLFGPSYTAAAPLLPWLFLGLGCGNVAGVASAVFHGVGRADLLLKAGLGLMAVNLTLDLLLIPPFGPWGAAVACATAQALSLPIAAALLLAVGGRALPVAFPGRALGRVALALAAGAAALVAGRRLLAALGGAGAAARLPFSILLAGTTGVVFVVVFAVAGGRRDLRRRVEVEDPPSPPEEAGAPPVSVIVPTKNRPDHLRGCLARVLAQEGPGREVIVVDSSDDDLSQRILREEFPAVRRVRVRGMPNNRHFAKNQGIRLARGGVLCFLDDDSFAEPGWLGRIAAHFADPAVGGVGGRIIDEVFGRGPVGDTVGGLEANGRLHLNFTRDPGRVIEVEHFIGCNMAFRASALATVGGFDLAYGGPNFMEETDLCLRVRRAGFRLLFDPAALVHHRNAPRDGGLKREMLDPRGEFWSARSRAYFALKLLPRTVAVLRYNALGLLKLHAGQAITRRSWGHARALVLQTAGIACGVGDWLVAGMPRVPPPPSSR